VASTGGFDLGDDAPPEAGQELEHGIPPLRASGTIIQAIAQIARIRAEPGAALRRDLQVPDLAPKKRPAQQRSRDTFDALVDACTGLLLERGYARTTTNHVAERAGVNIASLYEYFSGKDAIVAQVAERLGERVLARLGRGAARVMDGGEERAVRAWIELIHDTVLREKKLVAVFLYQFPHTQQIGSIQTLGARLLDLSQRIRDESGGFLRSDVSDATLHLLVNLVTSTIMQLVFDPPRDVSRRALLDELALRTEEWIRA
jgi:AcrR family transcriptional regulator